MVVVDKLLEWLFDTVVKPRLRIALRWVRRRKRRAIALVIAAATFGSVGFTAYRFGPLLRTPMGILKPIEGPELNARASSKSDLVMLPQIAGPTTITYGPENIIDSKLETAWQVSNDGIGEFFEISWNAPRQFGELRIIPGYLKSLPDVWGDRWTLNNRVKEVQVDVYLKVLGPLRWTVWRGRAHLTDQKAFQAVVAQRWIPATSVRVTIVDVYPPERNSPTSGTPIRDTCISEVKVFEWR